MARENNCRDCGERRGLSHTRKCSKRGQVKAEDTLGFERVKQRPENYNDLSIREQWAIDKKLGVLDWEP